MKYIVSLFILINSALGFEVVLSGDVYNVDKSKKILTFERHEEVVSDSEIKIKGIFKDLLGKILVIESATLKNGETISSGVEHFQMNQSGTITLKNKKLIFEKKIEKSIEKEIEEYTSNFVVGMTSTNYIRKNWNKILNGSTVESRLGVWYRKDTVGFDFYKTKEILINGKEHIEIKMSASSFIIRAIVDPIYFVFEKSSKVLLSVKGRISPKMLVKGKLEDLDAFVEYRIVN